MSADVQPLKTAIGRWARDVHSTALDDMPERMRPYAPIGKVVPDGRVPGELRRSIRRDHAISQFSAARVHGRIVAPVIQAKTTDQGSPPHVIRSKRVGGLLIFRWHGRKVHYHFVNHPGNAAKPWWKKALQATYGPTLRFAAVRTPLRR